MNRLNRKSRSYVNIVDLLKSVLMVFLLTVFNALSSNSVIAGPKPAIEVRFEIEPQTFKFEDKDFSDTNRAQIIAKVCEAFTKKWGFLEWCKVPDNNASQLEENVSQSEESAPQEGGNTLDAESTVFQPVWTMKLKKVPRGAAAVGEKTGSIILQHYLKSNEAEPAEDLKESIELYSTHAPKPNLSPDTVNTKTIGELQIQLESQRSWARANELLRTIPISKEVNIYTDEDGERHVSIPYKLCDLGLKKSAKFVVALNIKSNRDDNFELERTGGVDVILPSEADDIQPDYIYGLVTAWNVRKRVDWDPTKWKYGIENEEFIQILNEYKKEVYMHEDPLDRGATCLIENGLATSNPEDISVDSEEASP